MEPRRPGVIAKAATYVLASAALLIQKATQDGTLAAAGRQGLDELGTALKAFPDSIQTHEPGTIGNPTQGEVAAARRTSGFHQSVGHRTPSQIAGHYGVHQHASEKDIRTPSQIAADGMKPGVDHGQERERQLGLEM